MRAAGWLACVWRAGSGFMCERGTLCAAGMGWGVCVAGMSWMMCVMCRKYIAVLKKEEIVYA